MKKILLISALLLMFTPVFAETTTTESTISAEARVTRTYAPDTVKVRFYVQNSGLSINDIKQKNDKIVNSAITKIKEKLSTNESIKTVAYRINDVYSYKDKIKVFQKYEVQNGFEVKLKDLTKISDIIKIATDAGVNKVDNLNFYIEDSEKICNELLQESAKMAKKRAEIVASSVGASLLKPKSINPYCDLNQSSSRVYSNRMMLAAKSLDSAEETVTPVIEAGEINASASVSMVYYLK